MKITQRTFLPATVAVGILLFLVYYFVLLSPVLKSRARLETLIKKKQADLIAMKEMIGNWGKIRNAESHIKSAQADSGRAFSLLSIIENAAQHAKVEEKIKSIRPVQKLWSKKLKTGETLQVVLEGIDTAQLVRILEKIEDGQFPLSISRIKIERRKMPDGTHRICADMDVQYYLEV